MPLFSSGYAQFAQKVAQGPGSGLDADTLQGLGPTAFAAASHTHPGSDITSPVATANTANNALDIADGTVTTPKIVDGAVTIGKLAVNSVDSSKIVDGSIAAVDVNAAQIQLRVAGDCAAGSAVRVVNQDGTVTCQRVGTGTIGGSGTANRVPKFTAATTLGDSAISEVGGNVGIGTAKPGFNLDVSSGGDTQIAVRSTALDGRVWTLQSSAAFGLAGVFQIVDRTAAASRLSINAGGNVGVGTTAPNERLEIAGNLRLPPSTATVGVIKSGADRFIHNFGTNNFFAGVNAGNFSTTGIGSNTGVGASALFSNTTGAQNTASGVSALQSNTTGGNNTASGLSALFSNTTGNNNTASGVSALQSNTTGNFNTASGLSALLSNTTGTNNTAIGFASNVSAGNLTNATAIGAGAIVNASNKVRLGNTAITVVETSGKVLANGGFNGKCADGFGAVFFPVFCNQDVAETFAAMEATEPGDLVVLVNQSALMPTVRKSTRPYEGLLIGAVSTNPGLVFDNGETHLAGDNSNLITPEKTVVGLVGRVPVKVSLENGPIAVGDPLTSSSTEGVAMKATKAGQIIGYALEKADQKGKVLVHLQPGYYIPPKQLALLNQIDELRAQVSELQGLLKTVLAQGPEKSASDYVLTSGR